MSDPEPGPAPAVRTVLADLHIAVTNDRATATAHLHGGADGLVLDVDHPAVFLRHAPGRGRLRGTALRAVQPLIPDTPVQVRSGGRDLARLRFTPAGKLRLRPTPAGVLTALRVAVAETRARLADHRHRGART